jgi:hypothetical protein
VRNFNLKEQKLKTKPKTKKKERTMRSKAKVFAIFAGLILAGLAGAQEKRELKVIEDRDQKYMASKVYELKNINTVDLLPFVLGAVKRYSPESSAERMVCKPLKTQFIFVNTGVEMLPYVDDMVAKLDRPGKVDEKGSIIKGTGITNAVYYPKYRAGSVFVDVAKATGNNDGISFFDPVNNMVYLKNSKSDGESMLKNIQFFDRPVPQVEMTLNVYEISDDDLKELGIDYISWKNGPGANIFSGGFDVFDFQNYANNSNWTNQLDVATQISNAWGGFLVAPQFDATFIRALAQKGKAKIATSGILAFANDFSFDPGSNAFGKAKYKIKFTPNYQDIVKDKNQNVSVTSSASEFYFYLRKPTVNFSGLKAELPAALEFGWELSIVDTVEKTNTGADVQDNYLFRAWTTTDVGTEKLLASFAKEQMVEQTNGIPVLCDIPVLKYLFGSTVETKVHKRIFVTVNTRPLAPEMDLSQWAGELINTSNAVMTEGNN